MSSSSKRSYKTPLYERLLAEKDERIKSLESALEQNEDRLKRIEADLEKDRHGREKRERKVVLLEARAGAIGILVGVPLTSAINAVKATVAHRTLSTGVLIFLTVYLSFTSVFVYVGFRMVKDASRALKAASQKGKMATHAVRFLYSLLVAFGLVMPILTKSPRNAVIVGSTFYRSLLIGTGISILYNYALMQKLRKTTGQEIPTIQQIANWSI